MISQSNPPLKSIDHVPPGVPDFDSVIAQNAALEAENRALKARIEWFERQMFGRKSEKRVVDVPGQGSLLGLSEEELEKLKEEDGEQERVTYERRKGNKTRADDCQTGQGLRFGPNVPVKRIVVTPDELKGEEASDYEIIDTHYRYRLAQQSAYVVIRYDLPVIRRKSDATLKTATLPPQVLESSLADVSFLAGILVDKFAYHLPLYRQHQRLRQSGITLSRSTLTNLVKKSIALLLPIVAAQMQNVLRSRVLAMDETPIKAGRKPKGGRQPGQMKTGWYWPVYGDADEIVFTYSASRGRQTIERLLSSRFEGTLISDGHSAYASYAKGIEAITHAQCWAHTRRQYIEVESIHPEEYARIMDGIGALYQVESRIRAQQLSKADKLACRQEYSKPITERIFAWCHEQINKPELTPKDPLRKALAYTLKREQELKVFLKNPEVPLDTNHLERGLRPIPMGRKNWMFCWTEVGAEQVGIIQSLIATCQLHGIDPTTYLVDVLQRVAVHPAKRVEELTPRIWKTKFQDNPFPSPVQVAEDMPDAD